MENKSGDKEYPVSLRSMPKQFNIDRNGIQGNKVPLWDPAGATEGPNLEPEILRMCNFSHVNTWVRTHDPSGIIFA